MQKRGIFMTLVGIVSGVLFVLGGVLAALRLKKRPFKNKEAEK